MPLALEIFGSLLAVAAIGVLLYAVLWAFKATLIKRAFQVDLSLDRRSRENRAFQAH